MAFLFRLHVQLPGLRQRDNLHDMYLRLVRQIRGEVQRFVGALHGERHGFIHLCRRFITERYEYIVFTLSFLFLNFFHFDSTVVR